MLSRFRGRIAISGGRRRHGLESFSNDFFEGLDVFWLKPEPEELF